MFFSPFLSLNLFVGRGFHFHLGFICLDGILFLGI